MAKDQTQTNSKRKTLPKFTDTPATGTSEPFARLLVQKCTVEDFSDKVSETLAAAEAKCGKKGVTLKASITVFA